ncbi:hypothetical protein FM076_31880 [Streptomyces albus subsp. chlorinus]|uniref:Uncharacterized protein n=1 Tax=Streptomyces albus subsp. chlorinus TaxID=337066 RepID=A0A386KSQ7_9ACTN|nr:hypothetical protein [Streptomyces albus]AYD88535.1 hypothetical protein [Streptomyces albus subsp. chlorinus]NSC25509.1 hypothetical protein [Streptomyces albus subsp. chlorinus]
MGIGIEVLIVDWKRVEAAPAEQRGELVDEAAFGDTVWEGSADGFGWSWPASAGADWYGRYAFHRNGSYKLHFWAGERWEDVRDFAEPGLRTALDRFTGPLFWQHGFAYLVGEDPGAVPERECPWDTEVLTWCPPQDVALLKDFWTRARSGLAALREPFGEHARTETGWIRDFEAFTAVLGAWGDVVTEADRRGWGIVGLRC